MKETLTVSLKLLSIATSAFLWYCTYSFILKPKSNKQIRNEESAEPYKVIRLKIPTYAKGAIIGKSGANIKRIQDKTKTTVKFVGKVVTEKVPESESYWSESNHETKIEEYDELIIRGLTLRVLEAEKEIKNIVCNTPVYTEDAIIVDERFIGKIIGKRGDNVKRLKEMYNVNIDIDRNNNPERKIILKGIRQNIKNCKEDILKLIETSQLEINPINRGSLSMQRNQNIHNNTVEYMCNWNVGESKNIIICSVVDCEKFYGQFIGEQNAELNKLMHRMTSYFKLRNEMVTGAKIGDVVAAYHVGTDTWQRAKIIDIKEDHFDVISLDYGEGIIIKNEEIQSFNNCIYFLKLPFQAIRFINGGLKELGINKSKWDEDDIVKFEQAVRIGFEYPILATLKNKSTDGFEVTLYDSKEKYDINSIFTTLGDSSDV